MDILLTYKLLIIKYYMRLMSTSGPLPIKSGDLSQHLKGKVSAHLVRYADDFVVMLNDIPLRLDCLSLPGS